MKVLVDTNLLIDYSKGHGSQLEQLFFLQSKGVELLVNSVVIMEYLAGITQPLLSKAKEFLQQFAVAPMGWKVGDTAGEMVRKADVSFWKDALIAATCVVEDLQLATNNQKHFNSVRQIKLFDFNKTA